MGGAVDLRGALDVRRSQGNGTVMGAALAGIGERLIPALSGAVVGRGSDPATATVRVGRFLYIGSITYIAAAWYWGWRNERVAPGGAFPIPGLYKGGKISDGAADADDSGNSASFISTLAPGTSSIDASTALGAPPLGGLPPAVGGGITGNKTLLLSIGHTAQNAFKLHVSENTAFGGIHPVHVTGSYHYKDRAIDCAAPPPQDATGIAHMGAFAAWVATNYTPHITELFWRGPGWIIIKNGKRVYNRDFVTGHEDHVHVAI